MKDLFTIGEISRLYGINYRTLRYYDEAGLLNSECINPENNYRLLKGSDSDVKKSFNT